MKWTGLSEIREKYLQFFESKEHLRLQSFSLIPKNDKSLLLISAGMAPLKPFFTGEQTPPKKRVTTCQKCIRTPDIELVGRTARHGTFFEMLGNFSFGDYFKKEVIPWAWEFVTEVMEMPEDRLYVSVYEEDDEAYDIWNKVIGVPADHIVRMGKEDNFWEIGAGPCGPCSEIYFDRGEEYGCKSPDCKVGCDCDRYVEFWNLVFTQFNNDGEGNYTRLAHPNIDTGMGLERIACIMQGVNNLFEVDTIKNIMLKICEAANVNYGDDENSDVSLRVITDHIRGTVFMVSDGILPSNEGRGYVLRRLIRRAARHGRLLGIKKPFLYKICDTVIEENKTGYPELVKNSEYIKKVVKKEEESFETTIEQGLSILDLHIESLKKNNKDILSGDDAFKLYDTFGFPIDLTKEIAEENNIKVDEEKFNELMKNQKERARRARQELGDFAWSDEDEIDLSAYPATVYSGYIDEKCNNELLTIIKDSQICETIAKNEKGILILGESVFYAESGGQVGDSGIIKSDTGEFTVTDTKKTKDGKYLHYGFCSEGYLSENEMVECRYDVARHNKIRRNHSAAHLLQAALRIVLGEHVKQAGSYVDENRVRFDFSHFSALSKDELKKVEEIVNEQIFRGYEVETVEMPVDEAIKSGAMALFDEKYGENVRVVRMGDFSTELCGGTHIDNTAKLGLFKIISETSVAAGVRRIEGTTGTGVLSLLENAENVISKTAGILKAQSDNDLSQKAENLVNEIKEKDKLISNLNSAIASSKIDKLFEDAREIDGIQLIAAAFIGTAPDTIRSMCDTIKERRPNAAVIIAGGNSNKAIFAAACGKEAVKKGLNAGSIIKELTKITGGGGGGRPESAMAGIKDPTKIDEAIIKFESIIRNML